MDIRAQAGGEEQMRGKLTRRLPVCCLAILAVVMTACGGSTSGSSGGSKTLNVAIVDNPQMKDIASLTPSLFTAKTGIKVHYTVLDETTLRQVTTRDVAAGGGQFDVVMLGPYEAPQFAKDGFLKNLTPYASSDSTFKMNDLIPTVRNALASPST